MEDNFGVILWHIVNNYDLTDEWDLYEALELAFREGVITGLDGE